MKLPWSRQQGQGRLAFAWHNAVFCWVHAEGSRVLACGLESRAASGGGGGAGSGGGESDEDAAFARRIRSLGLPDARATAVLPLVACQLLQVEAPVVPAEELKAAARWKIKELVEGRLEDLTIDVMNVGDSRAKSRGQIYVAAAATRELRALSQWSEVARLPLEAIDIRETAQRNVQTAVAHARGRAERANAALVVHGGTALLTLSAGGELFHARRLEWNPRWLEAGAAPLAGVDPQGPMSDYADLDIVDYGAEDHAAAAAQGEVAPIVLEMQRSLDVWDRSWPDLPLDRLVVHAQEHTDALVQLLGETLPLPVEALDLDALFPGLDRACTSTALRHAVVPLLGALLRDHFR
jgi:MSHA biogenesis protein MshI